MEPAESIPLTLSKTMELLEEMNNHWSISSGRLEREFTFKDFKTALKFVNEIGEIAEAENHHPQMTIDYNKVKIILFTHKIKGLSVQDFILAERINEINWD